MEEKLVLPILTDKEIRVLGCLIEKSKTTPDYYPMTVNAIRLACNQKTSRNPIVDYDEDAVVQTLDNLRSQNLVSKDFTGGRTTKYRHTLGVKYPLDPSDVSVLCLFMLRGPLTAGEINTYSARLYDFDGLDEVNQKLDELMNGETPFIRKLDKRAGQKENRFVQIFSKYKEEDQVEAGIPLTSANNAELDELRNRVEELESAFEKIKEELERLK